MASGEAWPPKSARQALLSSPSGRQKYADFRSGLAPSPIKRSQTTPSLVDRLRLARNNEDHKILYQEEDGDEDEETLQLKLAAIEAKLKLKSLQNKRHENNLQSSSRPESVAEDNFSRARSPSQLQVAVSPTKRTIPADEHRSPNRVLLGIDKGIRGADISLRRARGIGTSSKEVGPVRNTENRPSSMVKSASSARLKQAMPLVPIKSFSERMAHTRETERQHADKRESAYKERAKSFKVNQHEIDHLKEIADSQLQTDSRSSVQNDEAEPRMHSQRTNASPTRTLKKSRSMPVFSNDKDENQGDSTLFEAYSGLHLSSRILPHTFLKRTLPSDQFTTYRIPDVLKNVVSPAFELPDEVSDFVVFGVVASKSSPLDHKTRSEDNSKSSDDWQKKWEDGSNNKKKFMVFTITDLKWTIDLYLFDTAVPRYHRLTPGTVIAVLNPSIMPPKRGREDTGAFSLALHNGEDTVLEIGTAKHLGYCNAKKKDGKVCGSWVNSSKSEICEWHLNAQIARTQASRMGVNAGANGFGGKGPTNKRNVFDPRLRGEGGGHYPRPGALAPKEGRGFDFESRSHYYIASSSQSVSGGHSGPPKYRSDVSTARMLDLDDPFIAEGQFSRDKEARMQKRLAHQEKERDIARKLANMGGGSSAGADYMMRRANGDTSGKPRDGRRHDNISRFANDDEMAMEGSSAITGANFRSEIGRKRPAESVRLSPVKKKKTRFMTSTGIKEAGRESLGPNMVPFDAQNDDDDDDDLDIV